MPISELSTSTSLSPSESPDRGQLLHKTAANMSDIGVVGVLSFTILTTFLISFIGLLAFLLPPVLLPVVVRSSNFSNSDLEEMVALEMEWERLEWSGVPGIVTLIGLDKVVKHWDNSRVPGATSMSVFWKIITQSSG